MIICPYCGKKITVGAVTIKGNRYKCIYCNVWFTTENGKLKYTKFVGLN